MLKWVEREEIKSNVWITLWDYIMTEKQGIIWDKSVNLSHLLYAMVIAGGALVWYSNLQSVIAVHSTQIQSLQKTEEDEAARSTRIESKLDQILLTLAGEKREN
jgi:hypothetical protein